VENVVGKIKRQVNFVLVVEQNCQKNQSGDIPKNWLGGEKLLVKSDGRQKFLTQFEISNCFGWDSKVILDSTGKDILSLVDKTIKFVIIKDGNKFVTIKRGGCKTKGC